MQRLLGSVSAVLLLAAGAFALPGEERLGVGMQAPTLDHVNWIQGDKVAAWEPGQIYVLDFWATWCPPCRKSIPHLNALAKQYSKDGVHVIGVAIAPSPGMVPTAKFVADQGDGMSYRIAEDIEGQTAAAFMQAARCEGIPTIMVVDRKGELAWIGSPFGMDETLAQIVAGTDDRAAAVAADELRRNQGELEAKVYAALENYPTLDAATAAEVLKICEQMLAQDPKNPQLAYQKYLMFAKAGPREAASAYGKELVEGALKDIPKGLHLLAWSIVDPKSTAPREERDLELAFAAARRADELTAHGDVSVLDTLARVHFWRGETEQAVALQKQALELNDDPQQAGSLQATLDEYLAAAPQPAGS